MIMDVSIMLKIMLFIVIFLVLVVGQNPRPFDPLSVCPFPSVPVQPGFATVPRLGQLLVDHPETDS